MSGIQITEFLVEYAERCRDQGLEASPDAILRPALEAFLQSEVWRPKDPTRLTIAARSLFRITDQGDRAQNLLKIIQDEIVSLHASFERQESANWYLQEDLVLVSEALRQAQELADKPN